MMRSRPIQFALVGLAMTIGATYAQDDFNAQEKPCPQELPARTHCYAGQDSNGAVVRVAAEPTRPGQRDPQGRRRRG